MTPLPTTTANWLTEILDRFEVAALSGAGQGIDHDPEHSHWVEYLQRQAVDQALAAHDLSEDDAAPERIEEQMEAVEDLAATFHHALPDGGRGVASEAQVFMVFYVAALVEAGVLEREIAAQVVKNCWPGCANPSADDDEDEDDERPAHRRDARDEDDAPWPIVNAAPKTPDAWVDEIIVAYESATNPPPLALSNGGRYGARPDAPMEAAVVLALTNRGVVVPQDDVRELITAIADMEADVNDCGPEWEQMQEIAPLAFSMYYLWVHLAIGCLDEHIAERIVTMCTERIADFSENNVPRRASRPAPRHQQQQQRRPPPHRRPPGRY